MLGPDATHGPVPALALSAAWLLLITGPVKFRSPAPTQQALATVGLPERRGLVWMIGMAEVASGLLFVLSGHATVVNRVGALCCAACYVGFSAFLVIALRRSGPSCGCTGRSDTPPTRGHLLVTLLAAAVCLAAAATGGSLTTVWAGREGPGTAAASVVLAAVAWLVIAVQPTLLAARRLLPGRSG